MSDTIIINSDPDNETIVINSGTGVFSVNGKVGDVVLNSSDIGLTIVNSNSGNWDSVYGYVNANSSIEFNQQSVVSVVNSTSAKWNSVYSHVNATSSIEFNQQAVASVVNSTSAKWNSVYGYVNATSSIEYNQTAATTFVIANSADIISVDSLVISNSALWTQGGNSVALQALSSTWNSNYITTNTLSGNWNTAYAYVIGNSSIEINQQAVASVVNSTSANWNKAYQYGTAYSSNSSSFATIGFVDGKFLPISGGKITGDLTIYGNLTALGKSTFVNTIFTNTSALSVINTGVGPALYVYQAAGPYDVASFVDGDGIEVLHVGNANVNQKGKIGINESFPTVELTVNGRISASDIFYANGIESQGLITTTGLALQNSRVQYLERPVTANGNFIILNVNGEVQAIRLFKPILIATTYTNATQDGDWSNLNNWTDIQGYSVTTLPDTESVLTFTVPSFTQVSEGNASIKSCNFLVTTSWGNGITLTVSNSANFYNQSVLYGTISGDASFYNSTQNNGIIGGYASFSGNSVNSGLVVKNAVFRNGATNQNFLGVIAGNAIVYYPSPYPIGGLVSGSVSYRGYFATKFVGTAGDGNWNNLANWTDEFDLPVVFLPTGNSNVKIYSNVTSASGNSVAVNSATFYNNSVWGSGLTLTAPQVTLRQQSSNAGTLVGTNGSLFKLYNLATNTGTINSDVEVHHPCPNPIGGTVTGSVLYIGYVQPIISSQLVNIQGPENITSISLTCNGNAIYPNFDITTEDYGVITGAGGGQSVSYSLTINGNTTTGTINVDQALQIYNTTHIYYIRFINNAIPRPTITAGPLTGYVPGYYTIGQGDYLPIIYNHNGVPVWYTNYSAFSLNKGADRNRVFIQYPNTPNKSVYIGASGLDVHTYQLLGYPGSWDVHEGREIEGPPNRKRNILGHVYTTGFYIEEQTANHQMVWNWEANDYYNGGYGEYYHNNSIDVNPVNGNIVISCRHNSAALCIDYATKNVKWVISGRYFYSGSFEAVDRHTSNTANTKYISLAHANLLNEPTYSGFQYSGTVGNHDARWHTDIPPIHGSNNVVFSIYDDESDAGAGFGGNTAPASRGVIYEVDESAGVAYHRSSVFSPYGTSPFRGSYTVVHEDDGTWSHVLDNVVQDPQMLEFVGDIDTPNKPLVFEMRFYSGDPYRIIKIKKSFFDLNNLRATYGMSVQ